MEDSGENRSQEIAAPVVENLDEKKKKAEIEKLGLEIERLKKQNEQDAEKKPLSKRLSGFYSTIPTLLLIGGFFIQFMIFEGNQEKVNNDLVKTAYPSLFMRLDTSKSSKSVYGCISEIQLYGFHIIPFMVDRYMLLENYNNDNNNYPTALENAFSYLKNSDQKKFRDIIVERNCNYFKSKSFITIQKQDKFIELFNNNIIYTNSVRQNIKEKLKETIEESEANEADKNVILTLIEKITIK